MTTPTRSLRQGRAFRSIQLTRSAASTRSQGVVEIAGDRFGPGQLLVFRPGDRITVRAVEPARFMLLGGDPMDGPRHIWWNFVSSRPEQDGAHDVLGDAAVAKLIQLEGVLSSVGSLLGQIPDGLGPEDERDRIRASYGLNGGYHPLVARITRKARRVLRIDQDHIDVMLFQPLHGFVERPRELFCVNYAPASPACRLSRSPDPARPRATMPLMRSDASSMISPEVARCSMTKSDPGNNRSSSCSSHAG